MRPTPQHALPSDKCQETGSHDDRGDTHAHRILSKMEQEHTHSSGDNTQDTTYCRLYYILFCPIASSMIVLYYVAKSFPESVLKIPVLDRFFSCWSLGVIKPPDMQILTIQSAYECSICNPDMESWIFVIEIE